MTDLHSERDAEAWARTIDVLEAEGLVRVDDDDHVRLTERWQEARRSGELTAILDAMGFEQ